MVFRSRKVPKHLIIEDDYTVRQRPRFGLLKMLVIFVVVSILTLLVSAALIVI